MGAGGGATASLRRLTPSAPSMRMVVARVNGRRPDSTFSKVEMLIFARSARPRRDMRRRANSSRMRFAMRRLCCSERLCSVTGRLPVSIRTSAHKSAQPRFRRLAEQDRERRSRRARPRRTKRGERFPRIPSSTPPDGACEESGDGPCPPPPTVIARGGRHEIFRDGRHFHVRAGGRTGVPIPASARPARLHRRPFAL